MVTMVIVIKNSSLSLLSRIYLENSSTNHDQKISLFLSLSLQTSRVSIEIDDEKNFLFDDYKLFSPFQALLEFSDARETWNRLANR